MTLLGLSEKLSREPREVQPKSSVYYAEAASRSENGSVVIKSDGVVASDVEYKDVTAVLGPESFRNGSTVLEYTPAEGSLVISIDGLRLNPDEYSLNGDVVTVYSLQEYEPVEIHYSAPSSFSFYSHDAVDNHIRLPFVPVDDILVKRISSDSIEEATFLLEDDLLTLLNVDPYTDYIYDIDYRVSRSMAMETDNGTVSFPYDVEPLALTVTDISGNGVPYTMDGIYIHTEYNGLVQLAWNEQHSVSARLDEFDASLSYKLPELPVQGSVHILRNGNTFGGFTVSDEVVTLSAPQNNDYLYTISCTAMYTELLDSSYFTAGSYRLVSIPEEDSVSVFVDGASVSFDIEDDILTIPDLNKGISEIRISYTALLPSQYLEIPTAPAVENGDSVIVTTVNGVPTVTGVRGSGDKIRTEMDTVKADARRAAEEITDIQTDIEAFKDTVEATYAHQTEVDELTGDVREMQSAVWEAENLSPFFGMTFGDPTYWYSGCPKFNVAGDCSITQLSDGWAHVEMAGNAARTLAANPIKQGFAEDGATYTLLVEVANHSGGSIEAFYAGASSLHSSEIIRSDMGAGTYEPIAIEEGSGRLYLLQAKDPEADNPGNLMRALLRCPTGTASFDARLSLYKGTYSGEYVPYGQHVERYATQRTLDRTAESITSTITSDYLKKDGSNADSSTQYYTKTQIDQQVDNIYIGGDSRWTKVQDFTNLSNTVNDVSGDLEDYKDATDTTLGNLQTQLDGLIEAWYYSVDPTLSNAPAVDWDTEALRERHRGDLYYNVTNGHSWRWMYESGAWAWQRIPDSDAAAALAEAQSANRLAGQKRRIFTATPVAPYDVGDLWVRTLNGYTQVWYATQLRTGDGTVNGSYHEEDWSLSDTLAVAAKDIAASAGNPNLFPFFSDYRPLSGTSNQWYWMSLTGAPYTFLDNGWCHYERIHTGSSNWNPSFMVQPQDFIEPDIDYTVLLEIKNLVIGGTGTGNLRIIPAANNAASQLGNMDCIVNLRTQGEGVYRFKLHSRESDYETAITRLMYSYVNQAPDTELSFDFRVSLYKGDYQGDYKPYVFPQYETGPNLFAVSAATPGSLSGTGTVDAPNANKPMVSDWIPVEPGTFYALSIDFEDGYQSWDSCCYYDANKVFLARFSYHATNSNAHVRGNWLCPADAAYVRLSANTYAAKSDFSDAHCKMKFAKGRFCTEWTAAPEDTEAEISYIVENYATNASLNVDPTKGEIGLHAQAIYEKAEAYTDGKIETEISDRNTAIEQSADAIELAAEAKYTTKDEFAVIPTGNILRNVIDPKIVSSESSEYWCVQSGGTGDGSIVTVSDSPVSGVSKAFHLENHTSGNRDFGQVVTERISAGKPYIFECWVRALGEEAFWQLRLYGSTGMTVHSGIAKPEYGWHHIFMWLSPIALTGSRQVAIFGATGSTALGTLEFLAPSLRQAEPLGDLVGHGIWETGDLNHDTGANVSATNRVRTRTNSRIPIVAGTTYVVDAASIDGEPLLAIPVPYNSSGTFVQSDDPVGTLFENWPSEMPYLWTPKESSYVRMVAKRADDAQISNLEWNIPEVVDLITLSPLDAKDRSNNKMYATKAALKVEADQIYSEVSKTYASKYDAFENNLIDPDAISNGYISVSGDITPMGSSKECTTGFIPVTAGDFLSLFVYLDEVPASAWTMWIAYAFYDSEQTLLGSRVSKYGAASVDLAMSYTGVKVPIGAAYIRCSWRTYGVANHAGLVQDVYSRVVQNENSITTIFSGIISNDADLYFTSASLTVPPAAPIAHVTSTADVPNAWTRIQPSYNSSYPYYYRCVETETMVQDPVTGTVSPSYSWGSVYLDAALTDVSNPDREGRNLLRKSDNFSAANWAMARASVPENGILQLTPTTSTGVGKYLVDYLDYSEYGPGYYTVSCEAKLADVESAYTTAGKLGLYFGVNASSRMANVFSATYDKYARKDPDTVLTDEWVRYSRTFYLPDDLGGTDAALVAGSNLTVQFLVDAKKKPALVRNIQLERSAVATPWKRAREDLESWQKDAGNPNIFPFFSDYKPLAVGSNQWYWNSFNQNIEKLEDGWARFKLTTAGSGNADRAFYVQAQDFVEPGEYYTYLIEVRNLDISGGTAWITTSGSASAQIAPPVGNVAYYLTKNGSYRMLLKAKDAATYLTASYLRFPAGTTGSVELRASLYKGDYLGDYKPYVFPQYETGPNLFDMSTIEAGYLESGGTVHEPVTSGYDSTCAVSDYIPVEPGAFYALSIDTGSPWEAQSWDRCCYYDSNKTGLGTFSYHGVGADSSVRGNFLVPDNAAYVRISSRWLVTTDAYQSIYARVKFEKGRFCTEWSESPQDVDVRISDAQSTADTANSGVNVLKTMTRQFNGGTLLCYANSPKGLYLNPLGSCDTVSLTWSDGEPSISGTLSRTDDLGLVVYKNGSQIAFFGEKAIIGKSDEIHLELDYNSMQLIGKNGNTGFDVRDLRDHSGTFDITESLTVEYLSIWNSDETGRIQGPGIRTSFRVEGEELDIIPITIRGVKYETVYYKPRYLMLRNPTSSTDHLGETATVTYSSGDSRGIAFTFGTRLADSFVAPMSATFGQSCEASGEYSLAEGSYTVASGYHAHAEGFQSVASGGTSHAEGQNTKATGSWSHAQGYGTEAASLNQTALGKYNVPDYNDKYAVIVGNGRMYGQESDALELDWRGNVLLAGGTAKIGETPKDPHILEDVYTAASAVIETNFYATADMVIIPIAITLSSASSWSGQKVANVPAGFEPIQVAMASLWTDTNAAAVIGIDTSGNITMTSGSAKVWRGQLVYIRA